MNNISYAYKIGIKEDIINALRNVMGSSYPDSSLAGKIQVVSEYPIDEVQYPMVVVRFNPSTLKNIGVAHYELSVDSPGSRLLHWRFDGNISFTVYALSTLDRDKVIVGLLNIFAFGSEIPAFEGFRQQVLNQQFVTMTLMTDFIREGGDQIATPAWDSQNEMIFTDSLTLDVFGEFFTDPTTGDLIEIDQVSMFPYTPGQPVPTGSQVGNDANVPWQPA